MVNSESAPHIQGIYAALIESARDNSQRFKGWFVTQKTIRGKEYLYLNLKIGGKRLEAIAGPSTPATRERWTQVLSGAREGQDQRARADLVKALRAVGGYAPTNFECRILELLHDQGIFRHGGQLVGTHAYGLYQNVLGLNYATSARTQDVDVGVKPVAISVAATEQPRLADVLRTGDLGALPIPGFKFNSPTTDFKFRDQQVILQFLAPAVATKFGEPVAVPQFNAHASGVPYLDYLLQEPISTVVPYDAGIVVAVPAPEHYAIHKIMLSVEPSRDRHKRTKDRQQAATLTEYYLTYDGYAWLAAMERAQENPAMWALVGRGLTEMQKQQPLLIDLLEGYREDLLRLGLAQQ